MKEFWKSASIWRSYVYRLRRLTFFGPPCIFSEATKAIWCRKQVFAQLLRLSRKTCSGIRQSCLTLRLDSWPEWSTQVNAKQSHENDISLFGLQSLTLYRWHGYTVDFWEVLTHRFFNHKVLLSPVAYTTYCRKDVFLTSSFDCVNQIIIHIGV